jgi:hypothetical protein
MQDRVIPQNVQTESSKKFDVVQLPSKGEYYLEGHPLHNQEFVEVYYMTAAEEDILTSQNLLQSGKVLDILLASTIRDKQIDPASLLVGDRNAILMWLRVTGYGADYPVSIRCAHCAHDFKQEFDLTKVTLKDIESPSDKMTFELPVSKSVVQFRFLTGSDESVLEKSMSRRTTNRLATSSIITTRLRLSIVSVDGDDDKVMIHNFVKSMSVADSRAFRIYLEAVEPSLDMGQDTHCPMCDLVERVDVPITAQFFWPDA